MGLWGHRAAVLWGYGATAVMGLKCHGVTVVIGLPCYGVTGSWDCSVWGYGAPAVMGLQCYRAVGGLQGCSVKRLWGHSSYGAAVLRGHGVTAVTGPRC